MAESPAENPSGPQGGRLSELAALFLRMGLTAFGGPAAHIAMQRQEVVEGRQWFSEQEFLDALGATNLIPGPNSTEMTMHIGYRRAGLAGLFVAGASFIIPAMLIVMALAWAYVTFGSTPAADWLLYGIKPVIIAVVFQALWGLGGTLWRSAANTAERVTLLLASLGVFGLYFIDLEATLLLLGGGLLAGAALLLMRRPAAPSEGAAALILPWLPAVSLGQVAAAAAPFSLLTLFLTFLKIGSVLYGSGYTLLAFLENDFVDRLGWLTQQQLIDAVAVGQFTPGPVFTTATFIGYLIGSQYGLAVPGALIATVGIFLPGFIFVAITHPLIPLMRQSRVASAFLDGVNACALALMAVVTVELAFAAVVDGLTAALAVVAGVLLVRFKLNSTWLILGGAAIGLAASALGWV